MWDGCCLAGSVFVPSWDCGIDTTGNLDNSKLPEPGQCAGSLIFGGGPLVVGSNFSGEESCKFSHGCINNFFVRFADPVDISSSKRTAWGKNKFEHARLGIIILLAGHTHVGIDGKKWTTREAKVINGLELAVEPHVQVNDGNALELVELAEVGHVGPSLGNHTANNVDRHGRDVLIRNHLFACSHEQVVDSAVFVGDNFLDRAVEHHLTAPGLNMVTHWRTDTIGLIAVNKCHL
mmetsp:Transcript_29450/g.53944  ORF Transcript_29450/g.53944 Transcript_29450/m.53944 type:complete len:235 (-) Transcript_29450:1057-1761(-)